MREIVIHTTKNTDVSVDVLYELYQQSFQQWHDHQIVSTYISESLEGFKRCEWRLQTRWKCRCSHVLEVSWSLVDFSQQA